MKIHRIYAIILRHTYLLRRSLDRVVDLLYQPLINLLLWGITSTYIEKFAPNASLVILMIISGVIFWLIAWRGQYDLSFGLLEELWNKNLINIFVTPIKLSEWTISLISFGVLKTLISFPFGVLIAFFIYKINIFIYGFYILVFALLLSMTGWWMGCLINAIILRYGTKLQALAWSLIMLLSPFSAIYYPLAILPNWAQKVALFIPPSYVFESARQMLYTGKLNPEKLWISLGLNMIYLILTLILLKRSFKRILEKGLVKLY